MKKIVVVIIGIALLVITLLVGVISTGIYGISEKNTEIYKQAVSLEQSADFGFENFRLTDYPVAFYDGDKDYVLTYQNGEIATDTRNPVLDALVATAYPVDGHYEVLVPTAERMSSLVGVISAGTYDYSTEEQVSMLWHEAFHCYQLTNFKDNIEMITKGVNLDISDILITETADSNPKAVSLYTEQAELLQSAVNTDNIDKISNYMVQYKQLDTERKALLTADVSVIEEYYTRVEGSARYIEACVYKTQRPQDFMQNYIDSISIYSNGTGKYYNKGMALCMILDRLDPDWKNGYDFSVSLDELIYSELEI